MSHLNKPERVIIFNSENCASTIKMQDYDLFVMQENLPPFFVDSEGIYAHFGLKFAFWNSLQILVQSVIS